MYVLLNFVDTDMLEKHPFIYRRIEFFGDEDSFATVQPEFEKRNLGRGVKDELCKTPEELIIEEEEAQAIQLQVAHMNAAISDLDLEDRLVIE